MFSLSASIPLVTRTFHNVAPLVVSTNSGAKWKPMLKTAPLTMTMAYYRLPTAPPVNGRFSSLLKALCHKQGQMSSIYVSRPMGAPTSRAREKKQLCTRKDLIPTILWLLLMIILSPNFGARSVCGILLHMMG